MEEVTMTVDMQELMKLYRDLLTETDTLPLRISGKSMMPFLMDGRDTVYLSKVSRPLKIGDMILYQRKNGQYILHRICKIEGETYGVVGDAHTLIEHGVRPNQIFGLVVSVERKGRRLQPGNFYWWFFEKVWPRVVHFRPFVVKWYDKVRKKF